MRNCPIRVVVCGTRFGEHYLAALAQARDSYQLVGILARGSERSRALAAHFDVPLYGRPSDIPDGVADVACVVVRTTIFGGDGSRIAGELLSRGIHVLQEHPVYPGEVTQLKAKAREANVRYHVNTFYPHLPAGDLFTDYAHQAGTARRPSFIELTTSRQLLYSSLDLLGRALGDLADFRLDGPLVHRGAQPPFHAFQGSIRDVPFSLLLQSYLDPADPDHHSLVMHRIAVGWPEGTVNLLNSFGPVVWTHALYAPQYQRDDLGSSYLLSRWSQADCRYFTQPTAQLFGDRFGPPVVSVVDDQFPGAIRRALDELRRAIDDPLDAPWQADSYLANLGQCWLHLMRAAGAPASRSMPPPPPPFPDPVRYAAEIANGR
ncbi:thiazolinyl imide reductase [Rhodopseudomonas palustris]|uniref:Thiazolinyl imide reductase n=1 Tax=Rhodopseudomonas palustris (strain BisB18) TaxID=316056 RepID=Q212V7_RHOPB